MIGTVVAAALWALAAGLLLSIVLGGLVYGAISFVRPPAAVRQTLWSVALAAAGFAPVVILAVMLVRGAGAPAPAAPPVAAAAHAVPTVTGARAGSAHDGAPARRAARSGGIELRVPAPPNLAPLVAGGLVALWALGALIGLGGLGRSIARVRGLKGRSSPLDGALATELPWLTTIAGREIYLRLSYETETPIAVGFRRPVILLPTDMATADGLTSIEPLIMHEYAHLARYDDWSNLAQRAIERLFWFNPVVWILGRRIALEREVAADEAVVARTHDAKRYASTLWRMAQEMRMPEHVVVAPGAMLTRRQISVRIERLLDEHPAGQRYVGAAALAIVIVAATGVAGLAAGAPPIVLAQSDDAQATARVTPLAPMPEVKPYVTVKPFIIANSAPKAHASWPPPPPAMPTEPAMPPQPRAVAEASPPDDADDAELGARIQADVAQKLSTALSHSEIAKTRNSNGPVTRELLGHCIGCDFSRRDLRGMDLSNMSLVGDSFDRADLRGANFAHSTLEGISFQRADLGHVNFAGARLTGIDFGRATLDGANLSHASLIGVDLSGSSLNGADITAIKLIGTSLP